MLFDAKKPKDSQLGYLRNRINILAAKVSASAQWRINQTALKVCVKDPVTHYRRLVLPETRARELARLSKTETNPAVLQSYHDELYGILSRLHANLPKDDFKSKWLH